MMTTFLSGITTEEMNEYLLALDEKQEDSEKQFLIYDILFYVFASACAIVFFRLFDLSWLIARVMMLVGSKLL